ncbi:MAG: sigma-70 family RNA polymerase sigma factor [Brevinematales bacterium]|nr:sigma-70 family RNA polymerase sigma factor [Brevinematales bacterium]
MNIKQSFYSSLTDEELLSLLPRDKSAEKEFYKRYTYRIQRWVRTIVFWDKEDLVQEGLIALSEAVKTYLPDKNTRFNTYAKVCVWNHLMSYLRRFSSQEGIVDPEIIAEMPEETLSLAEKTEEKLLWQDFLSTLSPLEKKVVIKRFVERKSYLDIASELAISPKKVDNILYKIRHAVETYLKK